MTQLSVAPTKYHKWLSELSAVLTYRPRTGHFIWKIDTKRRRAGDIAGSSDGKGRWQIAWKDQCFFAHRLAWLIHYGYLPTFLQIDHINGDQSDNRICNLRLATNGQNQQNSNRRLNQTGFKGVAYDKKQGRWFASIGADGTRRYLGSFKSAEAAYASYCEAAKILHGEFANV